MDADPTLGRDRSRFATGVWLERRRSRQSQAGARCILPALVRRWRRPSACRCNRTQPAAGVLRLREGEDHVAGGSGSARGSSAGTRQSTAGEAALSRCEATRRERELYTGAGGPVLWVPGECKGDGTDDRRAGTRRRIPHSRYHGVLQEPRGCLLRRSLRFWSIRRTNSPAIRMGPTER